MARLDAAFVEEMRTRIVREGRVGVGDRREAVERATQELIDEDRHILSPSQRGALVQAVADEALGLGPLEALLRDDAVSEVMVNGAGSVFVERAGRIERVEVSFVDDAHVMHVADRILSRVGRRVDEASPMADARLDDGSRVNVVIPPLAIDGPVITIRRFAGPALTLARLREIGSLNDEVLAVLRQSIAARKNILVTGGTGSGKTTTLAALAALLPPTERIVTIEDAAELRLDHPHVVRLESRPASLEGRGAITIRALVRNALRMRPDRIIVGEVRGGEALDMLQALGTGHDGSLSTLHASSAIDALRRLTTLALMGDIDLPYRAIEDQVASAIDLIVHQTRSPDGSRRIVEVAAVGPSEEGPLVTPLIVWTSSETGGEWLATPALSDWQAGS